MAVLLPHAVQFTAPPLESFRTCPTRTPSTKEIEWTKAQGITTGYSDGTFRPPPVNRDAMAFFYRAAGSPHVDACQPLQRCSTDNQFYREITWLASKASAPDALPPGDPHCPRRNGGV